MSPETWRGSRPRAYGNRKEQPWRSIYVWDSRMPPLYEVMRPAFRVLRVFGLAPYVLSKDGSSARMRVCNVYCLHSLVSACVYFDCTYRLLKIYENMHLELSTGASIIIYEIFLNVFVVTSDLVLDIARRGRIVNLCNRLANFDTALGIIWKPPPRILRKRLIGFIIANILIWSVIVDLSARSFKDTYLNMIRHTIIYLATAVGIFKFCGAILLLEQRFGQLNNLALRDGPNIFAEVKSTQAKSKSKFPRFNKLL
ncbi:PREDICTED: uncharacterized protein LOC105359066 [Ceratosolen solmsi marchali]|uniref:Uncharacterized protein LOC105359066 n=1 Tax=Ceratosolen solmsi marchali TaxID=326594 RepID=A0AAJ6YB04_9HYME|nr:PREDICTED: uncharacterized protein LOC105359066 [Ceratosolen solmsi marchali]